MDQIGSNCLCVLCFRMIALVFTTAYYACAIRHASIDCAVNAKNYHNNRDEMLDYALCTYIYINKMRKKKIAHFATYKKRKRVL